MRPSFPASGALRATSTAALLCTALAVATAAPLSAQVGHMPNASPYEDIKIGQTLTPMAGRMIMGRDLAGVAPKSSALGAIRYDIGVGGPASLFVRYLAAPSTRNVLNPTAPKATRVFATPNVTTHLLDGGLDIALTGRKTWHQLLPSLNGGVGVVTDFAKADTGAYQFGTNFAFSYGFSLRYLARRGPQLRLDLTNFIWQYQYPDRYFVKASDTTSVLTDTRNRSSWRGNWGVSAGVAIPIFR
ncbi:MAG: hypothetical protein RLZZ621_2476 [Gemmatimonadota bacterium]|jgi:hypothetical protein